MGAQLTTSAEMDAPIDVQQLSVVRELYVAVGHSQEASSGSARRVWQHVVRLAHQCREADDGLIALVLGFGDVERDAVPEPDLDDGQAGERFQIGGLVQRGDDQKSEPLAGTCMSPVLVTKPIGYGRREPGICMNSA